MSFRQPVDIKLLNQTSETLRSRFSSMDKPAYELVRSDSRILPDGTTVYRIRALTDIHPAHSSNTPPYVHKGDLGGYVQSYRNLLMKKAVFTWLFDDATVSGDAVVTGSSRLHGSSSVSGRACVVDTDMYDRSEIKGDVIAVNSELRDSASLDGKIIADWLGFSGNVSLCGEYVLATNGTRKNISDAEQAENFKLPLQDKGYKTSCNAMPEFMASKLSGCLHAASYRYMPEGMKLYADQFRKKDLALDQK